MLRSDSKRLILWKCGDKSAPEFEDTHHTLDGLPGEGKLYLMLLLRIMGENLA